MVSWLERQNYIIYIYVGMGVVFREKNTAYGKGPRTEPWSIPVVASRNC